MPAWGKAATAALAARSLWAEPEGWVSPLGTSKAARLPHCLENNPMPNGYPWGKKTVANTNPYQSPPNTGVTRHYTWTVTKETCSPDGVNNTCLLINGQFPGPTLEANWGDWFEIEVTNTIEDEGTSIHWHGLLQKQTPWMDGVPGDSQCPIAPGKTFTYRFQADLYGTSWYHSHYSAQYSSGLVGPMVIYGPQNVEYDVDLGPIIISDYYSEYYFVNVEKTLANPASGQAGPPLATNNLINGKTNNGGSIATFNVQSGKSYRMRLINPGSASVQKFSIDGYNFTIFANDFVPIEPYTTDVVTLGVGQRSDILFKATGKPTDSVWMRGFRPPPCGPSAGNELVLAAIFYEDADTSVMPTTQAGPNAYSTYCGNDPLSETVPQYPMTPPEPDVTNQIALNFTSNGTALLWYFNGQTFRIDYNDPMLLETKLGNADQFPAIRNAHIYDGSINSVRIILENPVPQPHPFHLHGHNFFVLQEGPCSSIPGPTPTPQSTYTKPPVSTQKATTASSPSHHTTPKSSPWSTHSVPSSPTTEHSKGWSSTSVPPPPYSPTSTPSSSTPAYSTSPSSTPSNPVYGSTASASSSNSTSSLTSTSSTTPTTTSTPSYSKRDDDADLKPRMWIDNGKRDAAPPNSCWDGSIVNPQNPQRRDTQMLQANSYIVLQWNQDNPGVWPLHCHIAWHLSAGMAYMVVENPEAIEQEMQIPSVMAQTCRDWWAWTGDHVVDQIDDGI